MLYYLIYLIAGILYALRESKRFNYSRDGGAFVMIAVVWPVWLAMDAADSFLAARRRKRNRLTIPKALVKEKHLK